MRTYTSLFNLITTSGLFACPYLSQLLAHLTFPFMLLTSPQIPILWDLLKPCSLGVPGSGFLLGLAGWFFLLAFLLTPLPIRVPGYICDGAWKKLFRWQWCVYSDILILQYGWWTGSSLIGVVKVRARRWVCLPLLEFEHLPFWLCCFFPLP